MSKDKKIAKVKTKKHVVLNLSTLARLNNYVENMGETPDEIINRVLDFVDKASKKK